MFQISTTKEIGSAKLKRIFIVGFSASALVGLVINLLNLHRMKGDGISYLDLADSYLRSDLGAIANSTWSPFFPLVLAITKAIFRPDQHSEFIMVQLVNWLIFVLTLAAFHWLFLIISRQTSDDVKLHTGYFISLCLFIYCSLGLISSTSVTPDMLLFGVFLLMTCFLLRYLDGGNGADALMVGILCGVGFLIKAVLFVIAPMFLICLLAVSLTRPKLRASFLPIVGFLVVSMPWVIFLSVSKGKFTFSDIGWINYCIDVGTCVSDDSGYFTRIDEAADLVIYNTKHNNATFPPWFDLSERWSNARIVFSFEAQWASLLGNLRHGVGFLLTKFTVPFYISFILLIFARFDEFRRILKRVWLLWFFAFTGSVYFLTHVEERYLAPFLFIFFVPMISTLLATASQGKERWIQRLLVISAFPLLFVPLYSPIYGWRKMINESSATYNSGVTATDIGLKTGDRVVVAGSGIDLYWSKLAGLRIIGEFRDPTAFWRLSDGEKDTAMCALKKLEVRAIVTTVAPTSHESYWKEIYPDRAYVTPVICNEPSSGSD